MPVPSRLLAGTIALPLLLLGAAPADDSPLRPAQESIRPERILEHIKVLSDDAFEGRGPGTAGEEKTVEYLVGQLKAMGLKPGNPDGSYLQNVPLIGFQATRVTGSFRAGDAAIPLEFPRNFVAVPGKPGEQPKLDGSDVVFVGYGVDAPEYGWDDFKGLDAKGKTLIMLVGDPPIPDPKDPSQLDPAMFKGRAMTYYGRWTYKYEIAAAKGAAAVLLVHETGPAGYPFSVVQGSWSRENFDIVDPKAGQTPKVDVKGWIDLPTATELFRASGQDFAAMKAKALSRDFRPIPLDAKATIAIEARSRLVQSHNVIGRLEGSDPTLKDEFVVFTAHWDHLGRDPELKGDQIYNGAADNASGSAAVLEIAHAATKIQPPPKRSLLFLFVTAEEKGLLGSKYYASNPLYPLTKTLADINLDVVNLWGKTSDLISIGMGQSSLDDLLVEVAKGYGRTVGPDADPEKGYYYRSDHFEFAKQGVPALDPKGGETFPGRPDDYGKQKADEYTAKDYHKVSDEIKPDWDLAGAAEDLKVILEVGYRVAQGGSFPEWKPGSEFRARREAMLRQSGR
ncbi:Aminopeptidase S [Aquisphaera giovannonii]|uniref:Aminopeptidase S n=1 Tax=Aquisphaera giovannonii TaxID=406548 RepID=A0A5B9WD49_9BACT|nr:M28 family metallopeptidase [Aquisphaera giovannonii]QEH37995.1 Aminopeptidase S [Aquisphaera giovannonii]